MNVHAYKTVPTVGLKPWERNPRTHSAAQIEQIRRSIREFGFTNPVLIDETGRLIAGHGRLEAAKAEGMLELPAIELAGLSETQKRALVISDNQIALNAGWDDDLLRLELLALKDAEFDTSILGFSADLIDLFVADPEQADADALAEIPSAPVSILGDIWQLGKHRVMCGDSLEDQSVALLCGSARAQLVHADPPYGMGKEADGVANDNIYREELDKFQMAWWATYRPFITDNASAYIWGNSPDLWRLWYRGGLADSERNEFCNQIVWDKKNIPGMRSPELMQYPTTTEHCLFFQLGQQYRGNVNVGDFPESWEPLRAYLEGEAKAVGFGPADIRRLCGVQMYGHWFTRSQFTLIPEVHHRKLCAQYPGHFARPWSELNAEWARVKGGPQSDIAGARSYFDNTHDTMRDVWEFPRVSGEERFEHATPKPVAMIERIMRSSLPNAGLCLEPFGGTGSTLIAAEKSGRVCFTMELEPKYCDVIVARWQTFTGKVAVLERNGATFAETKASRYATASPPAD